MFGVTLSRCASIADLRDVARRRLPLAVFDFIDGGAEREITLARNSSEFNSIELLQRVFVDVGSRDTTTQILGRPALLPLIVAPTGLAALAWPRADVCIARAARTAGIPFVISTAASIRIEEIAAGAEGARLWFQAYLYRDRKLVTSLVERAERVGCEALVITIDTPTLGRRHRDTRNQFTVPLRPNARLIYDAIRCFGWTASIALNGVPRMQNFVDFGHGRAIEFLAALMTRNMNPSSTWEDLKWIRQVWPHKIVLKGIMSPLDAVLAADAGVDAVWVSNHGGRQLNSAPSTISMLPEIKRAVGDRVEMYFDGGIRSGSDLAKGLASGARAGAIGRPTLFGAAAAGERGAAHALDILTAELDRTLALIGCPKSADLSEAHLRRVHSI